MLASVAFLSLAALAGWVICSPVYMVFDCTKSHGLACNVPGKAAAHVVAAILSRFTGRTHDFERA